MQNHTQTQTLILLFECNVRNKTKQLPNTTIATFAKADTQSKNWRKKAKANQYKQTKRDINTSKNAKHTHQNKYIQR